MRQLIVVAVILSVVQLLHASAILSNQRNQDDCGCENDKKIETKKEVKVQTCNEKLEFLQDENTLLRLQIKDLTNSNNNLNKELKKTQENLSSKTAANVELQKILDERNKKIDWYAVQLSNCEKDKQYSLSKVSDLEKKNQKLESDYRLLKEKSDRDADKIKKLETTIDELKCKLEQKSKCSECENELNCLKHSYNELKENYEKCRAENENLKCSIGHLEESLRKEKRDNEESAKLISKLKLENNQLTRELNDCTRHAGELESQIECLKRDLAEQAKECSRKIAELELKLKNKEIEWNAILEKEREATRAVLCKNAKLEELIEDLKNQLCKKQQELDICVRERNECRAKNEQLNKKIEELECIIKQLREELASCECRCNALVIELKECREKLNQCTAELKKCRDELAAALCKIEELKARIVELENAKKKCELELESLRCDADTFVHKITNTSEALGVVIDAAAGINHSMNQEAVEFSGSHKLGCNKKPDCGCKN